MSILQFNVRLAEGRVIGVALDLHQHALQQELASHFVYGYGKGGKESVSHQNHPQAIKYTSRMTATANVVLFCLFNRDLFGSFNELYRTITRTPGPVVLHFHVLRNYRLNLKSVVRFHEKVRNHRPDITLVQTLYGHWDIAGRCAFTDGYEDWRTGCQKCPTLDNYPPVKIDHAHQLVAGKRQLFHEMLALGCQFVSPNRHATDAFDGLYGPGRCRIINNDIDTAAEATLADLPPARETQGKPKIAVMAHDLRYNDKTNQQLVREMMALGDEIEPRTLGKFSPFTAGSVVNHGFEIDKRKLMGTLDQMDALVLSSRANNYPLILRKALSIGTSMIATHSDAAHEVPQKSGGKTVGEEEVLQLMQLSKPEITQAISNTTLAEFGQRSHTVYSRQQMLEEYVNLYRSLQLSAAAADPPTG